MAREQTPKGEKETQKQPVKTEGTQRDLPRRYSSGLSSYSSSPYSLMRRVMEDFERMFEQPFFGGGGGAMQQLHRGPDIDLFERDNKLVVRADLPGLDKKDIKLEVTAEGLMIQGERKEEKEEREKGFYRRERTYGSFSRLIPLPENIDLDTVTAEMKNGVLEVCFDLPEQRDKRRTIEIREGSADPKGSVH